MRLFLAVDLPDKVKEKLDSQISNLKKEYGDYNWVSKDRFHITLLFFGEIESKQEIDYIKKSIAEAVFDVESFILYSLSADTFINSKIVLHIKFRREKIVEDLVMKIKIKLQAENNERFIPHLTIARAKIPSKQQYFHLKKKLARLPIDIDFPVKKIHLFESILDRQKPIYKRIASFPLLT